MLLRRCGSQAGEVVVFAEVAGFGAALAEPVLEALLRRLGDVLAESPRAGARLDDPRDGGRIEGAESQRVAERSDQVSRRVALAQREHLARVMGGVTRVRAFETTQEFRGRLAEVGEGWAQKIEAVSAGVTRRPAFGQAPAIVLPLGLCQAELSAGTDAMVHRASRGEFAL